MWPPFSLLLPLGPSTSDPADAKLVEALRADNEAAFRSLFERYHPDLYRFLIRFGVRDDAAADILQDVFSGLWSGRRRLDPQRSVRAYLYRACRNRAANHFRNRARFLDDRDIDPVSDAAPQDERLGFRLLQDRLHEAVLRLPERRRAVFELCFVNGLSYKEAAEALDISTKTVENHMGYALKSIREFISPFLEDE